MKIISLLLADKAGFDENNKLNIEGIFNGISTTSFPSKHKEFFIVVITEGKFPQKRHHAVYLKKGGKEIAKVDQEIESGKRHHFIARFSDIVFPESGEYIVEAYVDKEKLETSLYLDSKNQ